MPAGWKSVTAGQLASERTGSVDPAKFLDEIFDLYSIPSYDTGEPEVLGGREIGSSKKVVKEGDILISKIVPHIRRVWIVGPNRGRRQIASGEWISFSDEGIYPEYLRYFLLSDGFHTKFMSTITGVGGSLLRARPSEVNKIAIPLPPLATQKHIARVLEQADQLRKQAQQMESELNQLAQSLFLEMFGDYRKQPEDCFVPLCTVADVVSGVAKGSDMKGKQTRIVPYLRVANVQDGFLDLSEIKEIEATARDIEKYVLQPGDILMTEGGDFDKLGRGAMWSGEVKECIHQNHIFRVRLSNAYEPKFFEYYLRSSKTKLYFLRCAKQTTNLASINMTQLKALPIPKEDRKKQEQFVAALELIEKQIKTVKSKGEYLEQVFQALMQRAFNGELTAPERKAA